MLCSVSCSVLFHSLFRISGPFAPADLSSSAEHDVVTDNIIIDGPLRCYSWFSFDVPADPSSSSSACSWFISFQLIHFAPAAADYNTDNIIIDGPLRCYSWFSFDVPADPSSSSSACSWFISFQLIHFAPAGSTWPPPDFEHLT
ncbi:kelch repeat-containing F-box family protein [Dorcoceras hygrometricum]|uniref:Kelch repeat-containing F-box family protein n=1 Tax=Dorcoceras hygrometricum TaxID=472368 RepID=A0A2Z7ANC9_9LAMI|nr:kelch repeat-containing F-box family protein [Dorcoceras hygrometricum]